MSTLHAEVHGRDFATAAEENSLGDLTEKWCFSHDVHKTRDRFRADSFGIPYPCSFPPDCGGFRVQSRSLGRRARHANLENADRFLAKTQTKPLNSAKFRLNGHGHGLALQVAFM